MIRGIRRIASSCSSIWPVGAKGSRFLLIRAASRHRASCDGLSKTTCLEVANKIRLVRFLKNPIRSTRTQASQRNGRSSPSANAGHRSIPLEGRVDRGAIRSLVTADTCLGPSETYLNERGSKSPMLEQCVRPNLEIAQSESRRRGRELDK